MRVKLSDSNRFFHEIFQYKKYNLSALSRLTNTNYSTFKKYYRGEYTLPKPLFLLLLKYSPHKDFWKRSIEELEDIWGMREGGVTSARKVDSRKRMAYARTFRKLINVKIVLNEIFCEFYGILLGDGCITRYKDNKGIEKLGIYITCNKNLDSYYLKKWKIILEDEYNLRPSYYEYKDKNACRLIIRNRLFCLDLHKKFDVPIGLKYNSLKISSKILTLPWRIKKYVLRGLFDTDGILFARKDEYYKYPHIAITSKSRLFLNQIKSLLREQNYPAYINGKDVRIKGIFHTKRWFEDIGSSNPRNTDRYQYFIKHGYLPPRSKGLW